MDLTSELQYLQHWVLVTSIFTCLKRTYVTQYVNVWTNNWREKKLQLEQQLEPGLWSMWKRKLSWEWTLGHRFSESATSFGQDDFALASGFTLFIRGASEQRLRKTTLLRCQSRWDKSVRPSEGSENKKGNINYSSTSSLLFPCIFQCSKGGKNPQTH